MNRYLAPVILSILSVAIYINYIDGTYRQIEKKLAAEDELNVYLKDAMEAQSKLSAIAATYKSIAPEEEQKLNRLLPDNIDPTRLVVDVNGLAEQHGLIAQNVKTSVEKESEENPRKYVVHELTFTVTSTYGVVREFIADLEKSLQLRDIVNVSFMVGTLSPGATPLPPELAVQDYNVTVTSYSLK